MDEDKNELLSLYQTLDDKLLYRRKMINKRYSKLLSNVIQLLNIEYKIYYILLGHALFCGDEFLQMVFSSVYKNILSLYTCLKMNEVGLYGQSNIIYRNIFEYLMINKFILTTNSKRMNKHWNEAKNISINDGVIKKIQFPDVSNLNKFWKDLCNWNHATIISGQILDDNDIKSRELKASLNILIMLLIMNYNFLTKNAYNLHII